MKIKELIADKSNFTAESSRRIDYIVIHYTANNGDTAEGNCKYFKGKNRGASAHYFVDEAEVWRSVRDQDRAWHCGAKEYKHPTCRNMNSIGIELCSRQDAAGRYYFKSETVRNAVELVREKMAEYGVSVGCVLRHYDVTGKNCPAPFVEDAEAWESFKAALGK